jgi:hypothetical protein
LTLVGPPSFLWVMWWTSRGTLLPFSWAPRRVRRSAEATPPGPETKSIASRASPYSSASCAWAGSDCVHQGGSGSPDCGPWSRPCPVMAYPLTMGITDPPVIALTCLALALLARADRGTGADRAPAGGALARDAVLAALVLGVACAMKYTAWPALAIIAVMVAARDGARPAVRFTVTVVATAAGLVAALAPASLRHPASILLNTVAYPLGLTAAKSPAQSPLPGHLLATLGSGGHLAALVLLAAAGLATAASLVIAPPVTPATAARRIAIGLTALFMLAPATRFGYFIYPIAFYAWAALARRADGLPAHRSFYPVSARTMASPYRAPAEPGGDAIWPISLIVCT